MSWLGETDDAVEAGGVDQHARAKEQELEQMTDLEWYDFIQGEEETVEEVDPR